MNRFVISACVVLLLTVGAGQAQSLDSAAVKTTGNTGATAAQLKLRKRILKDTQPGKKLDFFTPIKGHEMDGVQIRPGLFSTLGHVALYKWGHAVRELGVADLEEANSILAEFRGKALSARDQEYLKSGYYQIYER
ncbi:hypothetical protein [Hymenobacter sp. DG01]|uniref:hypothetical protein n=1 Tax=Hymenobacter sp. DG01 TaxID=2584940 RepID=UPI0011237908|nr:hypothetical protein [Hymenobacter sp. DG01]